MGVPLKGITLARDIVDQPEGARRSLGRLFPHGVQLAGLQEFRLVDVGREHDVVGLPNDLENGRLRPPKVEDHVQVIRAHDAVDSQVVFLPRAAEQSCVAGQSNRVK